MFFKENLKFSIKKIPKIQLNLIEEIFWEMQQKKVQKKKCYVQQETTRDETPCNLSKFQNRTGVTQVMANVLKSKLTHAQSNFPIDDQQKIKQINKKRNK